MTRSRAAKASPGAKDRAIERARIVHDVGPRLSLRRWTSSGRDLTAASRFVTECNVDLGWLSGALAEQIAAALVEAYDIYPELALDHPRHGLADAMAKAGASSAEQKLSHLILARLLDPTPDRTLAVLIEGSALIDPDIYEREVSHWLVAEAEPSHVFRLMRALSRSGLSADRLEVIGHLVAAGTSQSPLSTQMAGGFAYLLTQASDDAAGSLPNGQALIRARQAVKAQVRERGTPGDPAGSRLATVSRIRSLLHASGYNAARPPIARRGRTIDIPSWVGEWSQYLGRSGSGCLRAAYFHSDHARRDPVDGGLVAKQAAPYELARSRAMEMPSGRFHVDFKGSVEGDTLLRCEVSGYTGRRGQHCLGATTIALSPVGNGAILGSMVFALDERAAEVVFSVYVQKAGGAVKLLSVDMRPMMD